MQHSQGFLKLTAEARARVKEIPAAQLRERILRGDAPPILDVREDHEWSGGRILGARHLGRGILERDIESLIPERDRELVLYCGGGFRSALAAESLQKMGYTRVLSLAGGYRGWTEAGGETESGPA